MGDRQRNFAQYATALNQYANFNNDGDRSSRERGDGGPGGVPGGNNNGNAGGSGSSSSASHGGASAGNAALWGELSRSLQYNNYPGFGTAWQGGGSDMRLYGYGGYGEGQVDGRGEARSEGRSEGRRVPSKGETKATPPLPPGMGASMGSALASLQQLVTSGSSEAANVYRNILAARQYAAAAAALGALPTPPPPSINPAALHAASALSGHHQQQQRRQQQHHQQQLQQQQAAAFVAAAAGLNGEGLGMHGASRMQQPSPQGRKCTPVPTELRHEEPLPSPGRSRSHPPPTLNNQETICTPVIGKGMPDQQTSGGDNIGEMGADGRRVQSGSESEGDQRIRHRRKQEQPRRQSVIYPVAMQSESGGAGDSSSDDSQGYDLLLSRSNAIEHRDSPHDSLHSNSPVDPALRLSRDTFPAQGMSQAMSHALAHPFLAAHLNASQLLQVARTTPPPTKQDVPPAPSPHSHTHQLQVRTDLLEPHPTKEVESPFSSQEPPPRPMSQPPQLNLPEVDIRCVRTPPSNASVDSSSAPVKKRRCSPSYMESETSSVSDMIVKAPPVDEQGEKNDVGENNSLSSVSSNQIREESTKHTLSSSVENTPVNGLSGPCEVMDKNASSSSGSGSDSQSSLNVSMPSCETDNALTKNVDKSDQEFYNGDNEMLSSPRKRNRKRKSESEAIAETDAPSNEPKVEESAESKRRTRQKRAISYVEDGTDPVLEMNEDSSPDTTPVKKKGRKIKEVRDRTDSEAHHSPESTQGGDIHSSPPTLGPPPLPPPAPPPAPPPPPPLPLLPSLSQEESPPPKSMHNSPPGRGRGKGLYRGTPRNRGRLQGTTNTQEFSSVTEPLHVDTSLSQEPDLRVPGPPPITPSSCSPDVYDFNDTDSDGVGRGKKCKRGRKKGCSPKKNSKSPMEMVKATLSPRSRDTVVKSPKSPKFFSSSRSPVSERNKEWLRGISPPVREATKMQSEVSENPVNTCNHAPQSSSDEKAIDVQNSENCDNITADNNTKGDANVTSPRRSSRRAKTRELDSSLLDIRDDSSDVSLQSLPSNSKMKTSFSGSIVTAGHNSEEKGEKLEEAISMASDAVDSSPSSRVRRRGKRSGDQDELMEDKQHLTNDIISPTPDKEVLPLCESLVAKDEKQTEKNSITDTAVEKVNSVTPPKKSGRGRPPKVQNDSSADDKGKLKKPKKRKRKFTSAKKCKKRVEKLRAAALPGESKQYQSVPEDDSCINPDISSDVDPLKVELPCAEDSSKENDVTMPQLGSITSKLEDSPLHSRSRKATDGTSCLKNEKLQGSLDDLSKETIPKCLDAPESVEENSTVIAQMEEVESRSRRLRLRRASAKQDSKPESESNKPKLEDLSANDVIKSLKVGVDSQTDDEEKVSLPTTQKNDIKEMSANIKKSDLQSVHLADLQGKKSIDLGENSNTTVTVSGTQCQVSSRVPEPAVSFLKNNKEIESFGNQFKSFLENTQSRETQESLNAEDGGQSKIEDGCATDASLGVVGCGLPPVVNSDEQLMLQDKKEDLKTDTQNKLLHSASENPEESPKRTGEGTSADMSMKAMGDEAKSSEQEITTVVTETPKPHEVMPENHAPCVDGVDPNAERNSILSIPSEILLDPETSSNIPLATTDVMEVPQGTDMDVDAETVENIAKFLEETASTIPGATEESYSDKRPKRASRPPRKMDDSEMNDLLMLLNMEDEESEDEDYVPKDLENMDSTAESDDGADSDVNDDDDDDDSFDDFENEGKVGSTLSNFMELAGDITGDNDKVPTGLKHAKGTSTKSKGLKNGKGKKYKSDNSNSKKGKVKGKVKSSGKGRHDDDVRKRGDDGRKKGEGGEKKGPYIRVEPSTSGEVIVNTPSRDEEEQDKQVRKLNIQFYCKIEAKQKTAKVGYNSTLHNNYDAFSKDTTWFCSLCKNYSHTWKLGDLFGPYFIEGLTLRKKKYPKVIEGQVVESSSPNEVSRFKKRPPRRESTSDAPGDPKKLELGGCSPPWRFVPAATPARMLQCRPGSKEGGTQPNADTANPLSTSNTKEDSTGNVVTPVTTPAETRPPGTECWVHESCLLWSPGVHIINSKLCGLEEAVIHAQDSICTNCSEAGATVGCLGKGCSLMVHVPCATQLHWTLDYLTFRSFCPKHCVSSSSKDQSEESSVVQ